MLKCGTDRQKLVFYRTSPTIFQQNLVGAGSNQFFENNVFAPSDGKQELDKNDIYLSLSVLVRITGP